MLWLNLIGENNGTFYLDIFSCEMQSRSGRFAWSLSGTLGDGQWESPAIVELGDDIGITFLQDDWSGLRPSWDRPGIDLWELKEAIRDAFDASRLFPGAGTGKGNAPLATHRFKGPGKPNAPEVPPRPSLVSEPFTTFRTGAEHTSQNSQRKVAA